MTWTEKNIPDLSGKTVIITGANSGLGFEATKMFVEHNATVIMACRSLDKAKIAKEEVLKEIPDAKLDIIQLNLANLDSIRKFVKEFKEKYNKLDILCNNAGIMQTPNLKTDDGFDLQLGVNHFGHFVLTGLLFDVLRNTGGSRVINQSSFAHKFGKMDFDNLNWEKGKYNPTDAYGRSKLANLLFTYELDRKLKEHKIQMKSIAVHPGYSNTNLQSTGVNLDGGSRLFRWGYKITDKFAQSARMGAMPMLMAAVSDKVNSGDFIGPKWVGFRGYPKKVKSNKVSYNEEDAKKLWELSEKLTKVDFDFS